MDSLCDWLCTPTCILGLFILYKLMDFFIRKPYIGGYADRYIFITGCDTGFGNLLAKRLDSLGCHVFAGCLTENGETQLKKSCSDRLLPVSLDVTKPDSIKKAFDVVTGKLPPGKGIWGVVNNAGIGGHVGPLEWLTVDDFRSTADVNLFGLINVTMTFLPLIKKAHGRVVNMASGAGRISLVNIFAYCVSKYGVEAFTDGLRRSLRPYGCKAILIEPGCYKTWKDTLWDQLRPQLQTLWDRLSPDIRNDFGEEYYNSMTAFCKELDHIASNRLGEVIDAYEHALFGRWPRARYLPGFDVKYFWMPVTYLPEWLSDMILARFDKTPLPAVLNK